MGKSECLSASNFCRHVEYCMHRVNLLRHCGVKPILVFDGGLLPMKGEQENKRARYAGHLSKFHFQVHSECIAF